MATLKSANVTKYDNGGSGDNYIADGFIKSVEKVWIDTFTAGTTAIGTDDSICIGKVPKGKKITSIVVQMPALNPTSTLCTVFVDTGATILMTAGSTFFGAALQPRGNAGGTVTFASGTADMLFLEGSCIGKEVPIDADIYIKIYSVAGADVINTGGTIRSIIKYT